jgi:hypothetical protein
MRQIDERTRDPREPDPAPETQENQTQHQRPERTRPSTRDPREPDPAPETRENQTQHQRPERTRPSTRDLREPDPAPETRENQTQHPETRENQTRTQRYSVLPQRSRPSTHCTAPETQPQHLPHHPRDMNLTLRRSLSLPPDTSMSAPIARSVCSCPDKDPQDEVRTSDSVSQANSTYSRAERKAKIAVLLVKKRAEEQRFALEAEEMAIIQRKRQLNLQEELDAAMAEDEAYEEEETKSSISVNRDLSKNSECPPMGKSTMASTRDAYEVQGNPDPDINEEYENQACAPPLSQTSLDYAAQGARPKLPSNKRHISCPDDDQGGDVHINNLGGTSLSNRQFTSLANRTTEVRNPIVRTPVPPPWSEPTPKVEVHAHQPRISVPERSFRTPRAIPQTISGKIDDMIDDEIGFKTPTDLRQPEFPVPLPSTVRWGIILVNEQLTRNRMSLLDL